jgi:hypothetical protein
VPCVLGQQVMPESSYGVPKVSWPFDPALAVVKVWSYRVTGKGSVIAVPQLSQWLPMSVSPGTKGAPPKANVYDGMQPSGAYRTGANFGDAPWTSEVLAALLGFPLFRCANANGIAQTARSESRISALRRRCALMVGFICFFIFSVL